MTPPAPSASGWRSHGAQPQSHDATKANRLLYPICSLCVGSSNWGERYHMQLSCFFLLHHFIHWLASQSVALDNRRSDPFLGGGVAGCPPAASFQFSWHLVSLITTASPGNSWRAWPDDIGEERERGRETHKEEVVADLCGCPFDCVCTGQVLLISFSPSKANIIHQCNHPSPVALIISPAAH